MEEGTIAGIVAFFGAVGAFLRGENRSGGLGRRVEKTEEELVRFEDQVVRRDLCDERVRRMEEGHKALGREVGQLRTSMAAGFKDLKDFIRNDRKDGKP